MRGLVLLVVVLPLLTLGVQLHHRRHRQRSRRDAEPCTPANPSCVVGNRWYSLQLGECEEEYYSDASGACVPCRVCGQDEFQLPGADCLPQADRKCDSCRVCGDREFRTRECDKGGNRECTKCRVCNPGQYEAKACGGENGAEDAACADCRACEAGKEFEQAPCGAANGTHDRVCLPCTTCTGTTLAVSGCDGQVDTVCAECSAQHLGCATCNERGCSKCQPGYALNDDGDCLPCRVGHCDACAPDKVDRCLACATGHYLATETDCKPCGPRCAHCDGVVCSDCAAVPHGAWTNSCQDLTCDEGFFPAGDTCQQCVERCVRCQGQRCDACATVVINGVQRGQWTPSADGKCSDLSCVDGWYASGETCGSCPNGCAQCDDDGLCMSCASGFFLDESNRCQSCTPCKAGEFEQQSCSSSTDTVCKPKVASGVVVCGTDCTIPWRKSIPCIAPTTGCDEQKLQAMCAHVLLDIQADGNRMRGLCAEASADQAAVPDTTPAPQTSDCAALPHEGGAWVPATSSAEKGGPTCRPPCALSFGTLTKDYLHYIKGCVASFCDKPKSDFPPSSSNWEDCSDCWKEYCSANPASCWCEGGSCLKNCADKRASEA